MDITVGKIMNLIEESTTLEEASVALAKVSTSDGVLNIKSAIKALDNSLAFIGRGERGFVDAYVNIAAALVHLSDTYDQLSMSFPECKKAMSATGTAASAAKDASDAIRGKISVVK